MEGGIADPGIAIRGELPQYRRRANRVRDLADGDPDARSRIVREGIRSNRARGCPLVDSGDRVKQCGAKRSVPVRKAFGDDAGGSHAVDLPERPQRRLAHRRVRIEQTIDQSEGRRLRVGCAERATRRTANLPAVVA